MKNPRIVCRTYDPRRLLSMAESYLNCLAWAHRSERAFKECDSLYSASRRKYREGRSDSDRHASNLAKCMFENACGLVFADPSEVVAWYKCFRRHYTECDTLTLIPYDQFDIAIAALAKRF